MASFREIPPREEWTHNPFDRIHNDWFLIGAKKPDGSVNMMTANWGGVGVLWHKPVVYLFIRPQRYTKEFVDAADTFSLSFFSEKYREEMRFCGKNSGRDVDKAAHCGFTVQTDSGAPVFEQADTVLICKKLFSQVMSPASILDQTMLAEFYSGDYAGAYHQIYVAEVLKALIKN